MADSPEFFKRSDGYVETKDGGFVAVMLASDPNLPENKNQFTYKPSFVSESISIQWPVGQAFVVLPFNVVSGLIVKGYARQLSDDEIESLVESGSLVSSVEEGSDDKSDDKSDGSETKDQPEKKDSDDEKKGSKAPKKSEE